MQINQFVFNPFSENTWILSDASRECVIIDPGCSDTEERQTVLSFLKSNGLQLKMVLNTHCHLDHVWGNDFLVKEFGVPLLCPRGEEANLRHAEASARLYGIPGFMPSPEPDEWFSPGGTFRFGQTELQVLPTPGHTAGHVSFFSAPDLALFSGDVLFEGSIGRTDFPGGNYAVLMNSIMEVLMPLGPSVRVHSGHGEVTTLGRERSQNPFLIDYVQGK